MVVDDCGEICDLIKLEKEEGGGGTKKDQDASIHPVMHGG